MDAAGHAPPAGEGDADLSFARRPLVSPTPNVARPATRWEFNPFDQALQSDFLRPPVQEDDPVSPGTEAPAPSLLSAAIMLDDVHRKGKGEVGKAACCLPQANGGASILRKGDSPSAELSLQEGKLPR